MTNAHKLERLRPHPTVFIYCVLAIVLLSITLPRSLAAQTPDRFEVFGGYSLTTFSIFDRYSGPWQRFGYNGWEAAVVATLVPHLAIEGDFAGGYSNPNGNSSTVYTFMGGPRIFGNFGKTSVYAHVLIGGVSFAVGGSGSAKAVAAGGGANIWATRHIGVRMIQFDYLHTGFISAAVLGNGATMNNQNNFRVSTGVVFRF